MSVLVFVCGLIHALMLRGFVVSVTMRCGACGVDTLRTCVHVLSPCGLLFRHRKHRWQLAHPCACACQVPR